MYSQISLKDSLSIFFMIMLFISIGAIYLTLTFKAFFISKGLFAFLSFVGILSVIKIKGDLNG